MNTTSYDETISEILFVAKSIILDERKCDDGRTDSAMKENPFLIEMKRILLDKHSEWEIDIAPPRSWYDIKINSIHINLKLSDCKTSDNCVSKKAIFYSITGSTEIGRSNWNEFLAKLKSTRKKQHRDKPTEYHYLVKNKLTGDVILKSIFDIHTYVTNASNDLQINWKNEFKHSGKDFDYHDKVKSLLACIQKSVIADIEGKYKFAIFKIDSVFKE
jgi:hypothetical protein